MKCEICNFEYEGYFCPNCAWEEENIADEKYLEIYLQKKAKYKEVFNKTRYYDDFFSNLIKKFNDFLKEDMNFSFYLKFVDDILEIIEDKKYYFELLIIKLLLLKRLKKDYKDVLKQVESLSLDKDILEEDRKFFEMLKARL